MFRRISTLVLVLSFVSLFNLGFDAAAAVSRSDTLVIVSPEEASLMETLAAREIHRFLYLRTGQLVPIIQYQPCIVNKNNAIVVARKDRSFMGTAIRNAKLKSIVAELGAQNYILKTIRSSSNKTLFIIGGDDAGTLYGACRFAEHLGVRFYLHGDVFPDKQIDLELPELDEEGKPLFELRGIQPFHDFPEGPDWWDVDDYKAILSQLPKLGMNFFGLHTYPEGGPNAEPTVWIGLPQDILDDGQVKFSYPSSYMNTQRGNWGYQAKKTGDFAFGSANLFERDDYGAEVMGNSFPEPDALDACNNVFNRTGLMLREAFLCARGLGIKTCIGTETPLTIPERLQERLREMGKDPSDSSVVRELYEGIFRRIMKAYRLDYYWFWTPEEWTWRETSEDQAKAAESDLLNAIAAAENIDAPFTLATCGWVLGPQNDRALFDKLLPKEMPMSCINREVGKAPVEPGFADVKDRPKWAIPWLEDDPALTSPQLWAGRMRADALDALEYGCTGLIGIHWRTRILGPNVSALAKAAWDQSGFAQAKLELKKEIKKEGPVGGQHASFSKFRIANTKDEKLYQTVRFDLSAYHLAVRNGTYVVTLSFCESAFKEPGKRVFSVKIQGETVLNDLDVFAEVGYSGALDCSFEGVEVKDGWLDIEFVSNVEYPCVAAISAQSKRYTKRINCGGSAYRDYAADWPSSKPERRDLPTEDFYLDWALHQFGPEAAARIAGAFQQLDGKLPCPSDWVNGPGGIKPDKRPWREVRREYRFVDQLAKLRSKVKGKGNLDRFDYWLNNFRFMKSNAYVNCLWAEYNEEMGKVRAGNDANARRRLAKRKAVPLRRKLVKAVADVYKYLLLTVSNTGEMGTLANWEQHILPTLITRPGRELAAILGEDLRSSAELSTAYDGPVRVIVPTVRTSVTKGERLSLKVIILSKKPPRDAALHWRRMGQGEFARIPLTHVARGIYTVQFPQEATSGTHVEYYIRVSTGRGRSNYFPVTAPKLNQTLVVLPESD